MKRNLHSLLLALFLLFVSVLKSNAQSFHTVTFTGNSSDFGSEPVSAGGNNVNYYMAYDATNLYIAAFRINSNTFGSGDNLAIYIDTDPSTPITSGTGTQSGQNFSSVTPTLPFSANYDAHIQNNGNTGSNTGYDEFRPWTGSVWGTNTTPNDYVSSTALEIQIPLSSLGSPVALYVTMFMGYNGGTYSFAPGTSTASSTTPSITNYFGGIGLTSAGCSPINITNTPITNELVNAAPASGATYGYVSETSGSYSAAGNFSIASGGSININGGSLTIGSNTVNMNTGSTVTLNSGTLTATGSTFDFLGTAFTTGSSAITFNNLTLNGATTFTTSPTVNGTLLLDNGYSFSGSNSPSYGSSSLLYYFCTGTPNRSLEWTTASSGPGYPANVEIGNVTTLAMGSTAAQCAGNFTIDQNSTANTTSGAFTILGNVTANGSYLLGNDVKLTGNWTIGSSPGTLNNNTKAVWFIGSSGKQTITKTGAGTVYFDYLLVDNTGGNVILNNSPATTVVLNSTAGDPLQLLASSQLDINGQALTMNNSGGNILINGTARTITSSIAGGTFNVTGSKTVSFSSGNTLIFGNNVTLALSAAFNFGASVTTINGELLLNNGFSITNSPAYGSSSLLYYFSTGVPSRGSEWNASTGYGYPNNVEIGNTTTLDPTSSGSFSSTALNLAGNLTIDANSSLYLDYNSQNMSVPLTINGNLILNGNLSESKNTSGTIIVKGNFTNSGSFYQNGNTVLFNGSGSAQTLTGATTFYNLTLNNSSGLTLANTETINNTLTFPSSGLITTSANSLIIGASGSISNASSTAFINGNLGWGFSSATSHVFPVGNGSGNYHPVTFAYTATPGTSTVTIADNQTALTGTIPSTARLFSSRYWTVYQSGATALQYNITLDPTGFTPSGTAVILKSDGGTATQNSATTPNYTNSAAFTALGSSSSPSSFALAQTNIPLTITGVTANNKTYDGTTTATLNSTSALLSGVISPDVVTLITTGASGTFASQNVANNIPVTATGYTLSGAQAAYYSLSQPTGLSANITQASLTIIANNQSKCSGTTFTFTGTEFTTTPTPLYGSDAVSSVNLTSAGAPSSATTGSYSIVPTAAVGSGLSNYSITYTNGTMTVGGNTWIGGNSNWNNTANWSCGIIPNSSTADVVISSGNPVLDISPMIRNISLASGTTLGLSSNTLTVNGSITGTGTLSGTSASNLTIGGTAGTLNFTSGFASLGSLTVTSGSATLGTGLAIYNNLDVAGGTLNLNGQNVSLKSGSGGTASVNTITGTLSGATNVTVERYIPSDATRAWRLLSVPTSGSQTINAAWQEGQTHETDNTPGYGTIITANASNTNWAADGYDTVQVDASIITYSPGSNSWSLVPSTYNSIATTSGYFLYIRGDRSELPSGTSGPTNATTLRTTGGLYQGAITSSTIAAGQFGLLGNPYVSSIDFTRLTLNGGVNSTFYLWDPKIQSGNSLGVYQTFNSATGYATPISGGSYGSSNTRIESGAAFFVYAPSASGSVGFSESSKTGDTTANQFRPAGVLSTNSVLQTNLFSTVSGAQVDGNFAVFNSAYSNGLNGSDALKLANNGENLAILLDSTKLAVEARQPVTGTDTIFYDMWNMQQQQYKLQFIPTNLNTGGLTAYLQDAYLGTSTPLNLSATSTVAFSVDGNAASSASNRFRVVFNNNSSPVPVTFIAITAQQKSSSSINVSWEVGVESGVAYYEVEHSTDGKNFTAIGQLTPKSNAVGTAAYNWLDDKAVQGVNYYRVMSVGVAGDIKYTEVVKVVIGAAAPAIAIYPNPVVKGGYVSIELSDQPAGVYGVRVLNTAGQEMYATTINHGGGSSVHGLVIPAVLAGGLYKLEVTSPGAAKYTLNMVIQ